MSVTAIIPAAGRGERFGGSLPKQFVSLDGRPIIEHTLTRVEQATRIHAIVLAAPEAYVTQATTQLCPRFPKLVNVVAGGAQRQDTVRRALQTVRAAANDIVVVHCGARPLIRPALIDRCVAVAEEHGACIVAQPVHDTVKRCNPEDVILETVERRGLWLAQTPQAFRYDLLMRALDMAHTDGITGTDEAALVERLGVPIRVIVGDVWNIKITTPTDIALAEVIMRSPLL